MSTDQVSVLTLIADLVGRPWRSFGIAGVTGLATLAMLTLRTPEYEVVAAFQPASSGPGGGQLAGLAAQFGLQVASGGTDTPDLYRTLLMSRPILEPVLYESAPYTRRRFIFTSPTSDSGSVLQALGVSNAGSQKDLEDALEELRDRLAITVIRESGVVQFRVRLPAPELAVAAAERLLHAVNEFNVRTRQTQAGAQRRFVEQRLAIAQSNLDSAENALRRFLEGNRSGLETSPWLTLEAERYRRAVDLAYQLVLSLTQSLEQSRIDEVRDTPVITVLETPTRPVEPRGPTMLVTALLSVLVGVLAALATTLLIYTWHLLCRSDPQGMAALRAVTGPWRRRPA